MLNFATTSSAYVVEPECLQVWVVISSHSEQWLRVQRSSAVSPSEQGTQLLPQTEPSGTEHGSTETAVDMH